MHEYQPQLRVELRGELLSKVTARFPTVDAPSANLASAIQCVAQEITNHTVGMLTERGLSEGKFYVLGQLLAEEILGHEPPRPSDLASSLGVTKATVTGLLDGLQRQGLITRKQVKRDRRVSAVQLTDQSRSLLDQIIPPLLAAVYSLSDCLNKQEQATLLFLLMKLETGIRSKPIIESARTVDSLAGVDLNGALNR